MVVTLSDFRHEGIEEFPRREARIKSKLNSLPSGKGWGRDEQKANPKTVSKFFIKLSHRLSDFGGEQY